MRTIALLTLVLHAYVNAAHPSPSTGIAQLDLCAANFGDGVHTNQCIEIADFYREVAYDIAADIAQQSSQSSCSAIKGCNRGIHWHVPVPKEGCWHDVSYDDLVRTLDAHFHDRLDRAVCQAECVKLVTADGRQVDVLFGTMKAAVQSQVSSQSPSRYCLNKIDDFHPRSLLVSLRATSKVLSTPSEMG